LSYEAFAVPTRLSHLERRRCFAARGWLPDERYAISDPRGGLYGTVHEVPNA
jgi:hypothetical protein